MALRFTALAALAAHVAAYTDRGILKLDNT